MGQAQRPRWLPASAGARLYAGTGVALAISAALLAAWRASEDRRLLETGSARWIWCSREIPEPAPVRFRASKTFVLARPPASAFARIFGDPAWTFFVNGTRVAAGTQRPGDALRVVDAGRFLRSGSNEVVLEAASANGVGGLLFRLDLEGGPDVVSDETWIVDRLPETASGRRERAVAWGRPPMYPWGYPRLSGRSGEGSR